MKKSIKFKAMYWDIAKQIYYSRQISMKTKNILLSSAPTLSEAVKNRLQGTSMDRHLLMQDL
jgi:hypothetical protein